ncbi:HPP family protein [Taklimakanibacter deserti]|uniref:HPP family protein n=1 Tax=Taklimakanibacter deserti TaxID=2267839 RepID=UPI000E646323
MPFPDKFPWFKPILAGATLGERLIASLGSLIGIGLTGLVCGLCFGPDPALPLIVAPIGASAVLVFAVPASPLAQPWPVIGGNTISALIGVTVMQVLPDPLLATGVAVALAILVMSLTRSLHPPGGAAALTAVVGGSAVANAGFLFPFLPVALNSVLLVLLGILFRKLTRRAYPHVAQPPVVNEHKTKDRPASLRVGVQSADIDAALAKTGETYDIDRRDLDRLLREVETQVLSRMHSMITVSEIMSRDVVTVDQSALSERARRLLLDHDIRTLPVLGQAGRLAGTIGLRELAAGAERIRDRISPAVTARPDTPITDLIPLLSNGKSHAVVVTDQDGRIAGIVTQTDLLVAVSRALLAKDLAEAQSWRPLTSNWPVAAA